MLCTLQYLHSYYRNQLVRVAWTKNQEVFLVYWMQSVGFCILGMTKSNYSDILKDLKLYSLESRREIYCIIFVQKI